ncbi:MAG: hypothetical protein NWF12_08675 [Candidatus Bathyarchaeota archaeon]|nr:hypothetical protein [Candidatus Bathyarchaeota archaeon]
MPYCTAADVRLVIDTALSDDEIANLIEMSDSEINRRIGSQSASDNLIKKLSLLLTAHAAKTRQPQSQAIGEYREDAGSVLEVWEIEIGRIYRLYKGVAVKDSEYGHIEESKRYPEG